MQGDISLLLLSTLVDQILDIFNDTFLCFHFGKFLQDIDLIVVGFLADLLDHLILVVFILHVQEKFGRFVRDLMLKRI